MPPKDSKGFWCLHLVIQPWKSWRIMSSCYVFCNEQIYCSIIESACFQASCFVCYFFLGNRRLKAVIQIVCWNTHELQQKGNKDNSSWWEGRGLRRTSGILNLNCESIRQHFVRAGKMSAVPSSKEESGLGSTPQQLLHFSAPTRPCGSAERSSR